MRGKETSSTRSDRLYWLRFGEPVLPEDPDNLDQYMGAMSCYRELEQVVKRARHRESPIHPDHISDYYAALHADWLQARREFRHRSQDYSLVHVLGAAKRTLLHLEQNEVCGDAYQIAQTTHDLIEEALQGERPA